jgi:dihydroorotate dehydrogenase (NAD+) catalytic subunit
MTPNLAIDIAGVKFKNPILTASGTCGYGEELADIFPLKTLGGIVTKTITLQPRDGHRPPRTAETASGMLNAIGLANVGVDKYITDKLPFFDKLDLVLVVNVAGWKVGDYVELCARLTDHPRVDMIELNFSCPNVELGMELAGNAELAEKAVREVKKVCTKPIIAKLSPNVTDVPSIAKACEAGGADAISLINTLVGMAVDIESWRPRLTNNTGGLSGPAIKPVALAKVFQTAKAVKIPIIGIGGISTYADVVEFMLCGASAVQVGTALFVEPDAPVKIIEGLKNYLKDHKLTSVTDLIGKVRVW